MSLSNSQPDPQQNRWWGYRCRVNCYVTYQTFHLFVYVSYSNQTLWGVLLKSWQVVLLEPLRSCWKVIQTTKESKCKISISIVNPSVPVWKLTIEHHYEKKGRTLRTEEIPSPAPPPATPLKKNHKKRITKCFEVGGLLGQRSGIAPPVRMTETKINATALVLR